MSADDDNAANQTDAPARRKERTEMPEGHVIHRPVRDLVDTVVVHRSASSSPQGRSVGADPLDGNVLDSAEARGKPLFVGFASAAAQVHIHLGTYGTMRLLEGQPEVDGQVRWRFTDGENTADLRGPNTRALLGPAEVAAVIDHLGREPTEATWQNNVDLMEVGRARGRIDTVGQEHEPEAKGRSPREDDHGG